MRVLTITEALAEIKVIGKRIASKNAAIVSNIARQEFVKDPIDGGQANYVAAEMQSVRDLEQNILAIRSAIQRANLETTVTVNGTTRSITEWLAWRKEVATQRQKALSHLRNNINDVRKQAQSKGVAVVSAGDAAGRNDIVVNIDERKLDEELENIAADLERLDGQLSLKNATVTIHI